MNNKYYPEGAKILVVCANQGHLERCYNAFKDLFVAHYVTVGAALTGYGYERIIVVDKLEGERRMGSRSALDCYDMLNTKLLYPNQGIHYI